jgi:hypothetical protein
MHRAGLVLPTRLNHRLGDLADVADGGDLAGGVEGETVLRPGERPRLSVVWTGYEFYRLTQTEVSQMAYLIVHHKVLDYAKWKPLYDEHQSVRKAIGVKCEQLFRSSDDPNDLTILFEVSDLKKAREFTQSEDLKEIMMRAGVIGIPDFSFVEEVEVHELLKTSM